MHPVQTSADGARPLQSPMAIKIALFCAGEDTTSNTLAWTLFLVSQHPEVEANIVAELQQAGLLATPQQPEPRALQYEDLSRLQYLQMVIKARASCGAQNLAGYMHCNTSEVAVYSPVWCNASCGRPSGCTIWPYKKLLGARSQ